MTSVLAALDNTVAARPVLATAEAFASLVGSEPAVTHVRVNGDRAARLVAEAAGRPLVELTGEPVEELVRAASRDDVSAIVLGTRATPAGARPVGHTALAVAERVAKPVLLVPPDTPRAGTIKRVLVPLEGSVSSSLAPRQIFELAAQQHINAVVLHVLEEASLPLFTDQPQHEAAAWAREFLARYCPSGADQVAFESRVGRPEELIPRAAEELAVDLVALGWSQELARGRAPVVRAVVERARIPVLLVPVVRVANA
jgi:nucleotide-binding universal stress UspA family protein